ncbi:TnsD family Tn7-like transposition protein [Alteromonas gracilis]|uniref:TnsD family Tn7-like transposition protein n=1 Tax=Alteromonas gracilis TaxID=1479524 RepID=UPI0030D12BA2
MYSVQLGRFFPRPFSDEAIFSVIQRVVLTHGGGKDKRILSTLFGSRSLQFCSQFPSVIPHLTCQSNISCDTWITEHTVLPMYRLFTPKKQYESAIEALKDGKGNHVFKVLGITASREKLTPIAKYCPQCAQADEKNLGLAYWHIGHQLPGLTHCVFHHERLIVMRLSRKQFDVWPEVSSSDAIGASQGNKAERHLSSLINESYILGKVMGSIPDLYERYFARLVARGFMTSCGHLRLQLLRAEMATFWKEVSYLPCFQDAFSTQHSLGFPSNLFAYQNACHQPIKHLLLIGFLFGDIATMLSFKCTSCREQEYSHSTISQKPEADIEAAIVEELKSGLSLRKVSGKFHVSVGFVKKVAVIHKIELDLRPQRIFRAEQDEIIEKLTLGYSTQDIAAQFHCSTGAIETILSQHPDIVESRADLRKHRKRELMRSLLIATINELHNPRRNDIKLKSGAAYMWLYKHDKVWLYDHLPAQIPRCH